VKKNQKTLKVCYFGTYRSEYSRNQIMIEGLRQAGAEVIECNETLWHGIEDRVQTASGGWLRPAFWLRFIRTYVRLLKRYRKVGDYDVLVAGYPGQMDVFLARVLSRLHGKPLAWDVFMSIYLVAVERRLDEHSRFSIRLLRRLEWLALRMADLLILDTAHYAAWFFQTHGIPPERFRLVPTGADDRVYRPAVAAKSKDGLFRVLYFGTYIPNHGVEYIIDAARLLRNEQAIQFEMIGQGPELPKAQRLVHEHGLENVHFIDWLEQEDLVQRAAEADICLGAFGTTPQSMMTVQNKIYAGMAMGKPVINGDSPAVRDVLVHGEHIFLCDRESGPSLAEAICSLYSDPELCQKLAKQGLAKFKEAYDLDHLGALYSGHLQELVHKQTVRRGKNLSEAKK
jgi:glycosyltransferase involved in cell wall biosynthesis